MEETISAFLLTADGRALLSRAADLLEQRTETLAALAALRRGASPEQAAAAWTMADLRRRALPKFGLAAAQMYFVREALEQASSRRAAAYHAQRFLQAGMTRVTDLCGGIGADALAFAQAGIQVTLIELDPARALFAAENAQVLGFSDRIQVIRGDATHLTPTTGGAWFDPARRMDRRRVVSPDDYQPPLSFLRRLQEQGVAQIGVKLSPGIDHALAAAYDAQLEFLSDGGECKEGLLWLGGMRRGGPVQAVQMTDRETLILTGSPEPPALRSPGLYLYEPDPAVIRAHLVGQLARKIDAGALDPQIAYLTGDTLTSTPWAAAYEVLDQFPYSRKALQRALTEREAGRVIIKKRGFPQEPEEIRKQLKLKGSQEVIVVLTRLGEKHHVFVCRPA